MTTIWGVTVAEGPKFKLTKNASGEAYSRKLADGTKEVLFRPMPNMEPMHFFSKPKVKAEPKFLKLIKSFIKK